MITVVKTARYRARFLETMPFLGTPGAPSLLYRQDLHSLEVDSVECQDAGNEQRAQRSCPGRRAARAWRIVLAGLVGVFFAGSRGVLLGGLGLVRGGRFLRLCV
jgi:hypothetical protein